MRKLAVVGLVLALIAVGAWRWTAQPRTAQQAVGWCVERHGREVEFRQCGLPYIRGRVVGVSPQLIDIMPSEPRFGPYCPPETDDVARSPLAVGLSDLWLCLDTKPGDGNTPLTHEEFDRFM